MPSFRIISNFNKYLDKATNPLQFEPDADAIRCICEMVDNGMIEAMDAIQGINEKIVDENPHTVLFALEVLDKVFKKSGNLIHKVICTPNYMDFLHEMIVSTEYGKIKNKILELLQDWADKFKYLPQYCAPGNLLKLLQSEGCVFPNSQDLQINESKLAVKKSSQDMQASCSSLIKSSNIDKEDISKNDSIPQTQYEESLKYYREKKKKDYKIFLKSKGICTSSDEDVNKFDSIDRMTSTANEKQGKEQSPKIKLLPKELEIIRKQKHQLAASISEVRLLKHEHFMQEVSNYNPELKQCQKENCEHCKRHRSERNEEKKNFEIPKRLPLPMRKVKESKQAMKDAFEEYKQSKKQSYNEKASNGSSLNDNNDKVLLKGDKEEETQLKISLLLSQNECSVPEKSMIPYENISEDEQLKIALELSRSEARKNNILTEDQDDDIQEAIDNSFEEAEDKDFCSRPKVNSDDEDVQTNFATLKLSLEEQIKKSSTLEGNNSCIICLEKSSIIKSFQPCNHKCICFVCAYKYISQRCPVCRSFFTAIEF